MIPDFLAEQYAELRRLGAHAVVSTHDRIEISCPLEHIEKVQEIVQTLAWKEASWMGIVVHSFSDFRPKAGWRSP